MSFKDHFSGHATDYARYRPSYPEPLFDWLASVVPARDLAWDCATGSGQVAVSLARRFRSVIATDASVKQIENAVAAPNVTYRVEPAEGTSFANASVDLITVGQALHWLDLTRFYVEVRRVLRPGGVIAVWCYSLFGCNPEIDAVFLRYYRDVVGPYWPEDRKAVETGYRDLAFPFSPLAVPSFSMEADWELEQVLGYLDTWSSAQRYRKARGTDPRQEISGELARAWGSPESRRRIKWPLHLRVARVVP